MDGAVIALVIVLALGFSLGAYLAKLLDRGGAVVAVAVGLVIGLLGSFQWLLVITAFTLLGFLATVTGFSKKRERGLQEGTHGERGAKNVLGVSLPCLFVTILSMVPSIDPILADIAFISAISVAAADTAASEIGVKSENVRLITTMERVSAGTDGGVSSFGTLIALLASVVATVIGWLIVFGLVFDMLLLVPIAMGLVGCMLDSLFGATLESKGIISKYTNNALSGVIGALLAAATVFFLF